MADAPECELPGAARTAPHHQFPDPPEDLAPRGDGPQTVVLAGGCFWCVEAVYRQLDGVIDVVSGYAGGDQASADYETVCSGRTNHAEVVKIVYDPARISFGRLLKVFFGSAHDPTHVDRQGNDHGRQYRSAIFYSDEDQKRIAEQYIGKLNTAKVFRAPIATRLEPLEAFYDAEGYHQDYAARHPSQPYIAGVSMPKVEKTRHVFSDLLKK
ncbi:MAG: Peptide methionine sulfoxide reductase MsrA [Panacagrimonas sp.]|jgi:peptide-methionine (S)-S-oxide reductase|nr:peptide-methionine (S)-S-oxide reductase MsrA [Panacagrimonas sp.]MCC2657740.1 Peptide methionine sulfoxide reductase MsrA [Panacagrimonas sp.]